MRSLRLHFVVRTLAPGIACVAASVGGVALKATAQEAIEYSRDIQPILSEHCFACHGVDSASREADLRLDQREAAIDYGAIVPGEPDESELLFRVLTEDSDYVMPPVEANKPLDAAQKELLRRWIAEGAEYEGHWSFIPPKRTEPPEVHDESWPKNPIDNFVLAALEQAGLAPAEETDSRILFRRLHFDVTGLPPEPADVDAFVSDYEQRGDEALSDWIDQLMDSTAWGEHRARYWLDAARYADTHGVHFDNYREMWPYRDWVIRAFNANEPFDQFTVEQIAGDLLPEPTEDQLIATGFQRCNVTTNEGGTIDEENLANYAADRVQTFGWVYLGLTTNCSQCHDHKFDPITMKDYYSLAAFFRNTTQQAKDGNVADGLGPAIVVPSDDDAPRWHALPEEIAAAKAARDKRKDAAADDYQTWLAAAQSESLDADLPDEGLVVHLPLNEGAGDEVRNLCEAPPSFHATGPVAWIPDGKLGPAPVMKLGASFELGGIGDFEKDEAFSYGAWIKAGRNGVFGGIIARMDEQGGYRGWDLWQNDQSLAVHVIDSWPDNGLKVVTAGDVLTPGKWQHVFVTYDGSAKPSGVHIYVDGEAQKLTVEKDALTPDASIRTETPLRIGQRSDSQAFDGGAVQDLRLFDRALTGEEVKTIAKVGAVQAILADSAAEKTPEQAAALYDYYLNVHDAQYPALSQAVVDLEGEREAIKSRSPVTHIQQERMDSKPTAHILMRGAYDKPGEEVMADTPEALHPLPSDAPHNRLGLAEWLVDPANPLTARVAVNRFWQEVFGQGIVTTPENFGTTGARPSHPELLDWLAVEFRESGWDVKHLFKLMLMSAAYRQSAVATAEKLEKDRDNALLSRGPRFRMDAEMVRDNALAVSGLLSTKEFGPPVKPYQPDGIWNIVGLPGGNTRDYVQDEGEGLYRRSIYTFWKRMAPPPNLEAFNAPSREVCTVSRERTNTPIQALVTLNDPQFVEAARKLAEQSLLAAESDAQAVEFIAEHALGRPMSERESEIVLASKADLLAYYEAHEDDARKLIEVGDSAWDERCEPAELAAWTMVCNQIMNLDEVLCK